MNRTKKVLEILADRFVFDVDDLTMEMKLKEELGCDSLDREVIAEELEHFFGVDLAHGAECEWVTVQDVINAAKP